MKVNKETIGLYRSIVDGLKQKPAYLLFFGISALFALSGVATGLTAVTNQDLSFGILALISFMAALVACVIVIKLIEEPAKVDETKIHHPSTQLTAPISDSQNAFPKVTEELLLLAKRAKSDSSPVDTQSIDVMGARVIHSIYKALQSDEHYITKALMNNLSAELRNANKIMATDVHGQEAWMIPTAYLYLATQIRHYVKGNVRKGAWNLTVSPTLGAAILKACENARNILDSNESYSSFGHPQEFSWCIGTPSLEFSRILIWSREELLSPIAETIISIHSAFYIPLFYLEASPQTGENEIDYVLIQRDDSVYSGFFSHSGQHFRPKKIQKNGVLKGHFNAQQHYLDLLNRPDILLAVDALEKYRS